jgi:PAS domain S-box-containing protein
MKKDRTEKKHTPETPEMTQCTTDLKESTMELKELEAVLKKTEEEYKNIFENAMEGIFQTDSKGRFTRANPSFARIHGYDSPQDLIDSIINIAHDLFVDAADHKKLIEFLKKFGSIQNYETQTYTKDRTTHWISMNVMVFRDENGKTLYYEGTMLDITERKKAEEALSESEERYRVAIENSNDGILILQGDICQYANKQFIKMFEFDSPEEVVGKSIKPTIHPDDIERVSDIINKRQRGEPVPSRYEFKGITKKGNIFYVEVSAANITYRGMSVYLIYLRDITERKRAEESLMKSHKELERLNKAKTKAVDHISHELKTPLAVIQGNIRLLKRKLEDTSPPAIESIIEALERNTERLLEISRETDEIFRVSQEVEAGIVLGDLDRLLVRMENFSEIPEAIRAHWEILKEWTSKYLAGSTASFQSIDLYTAVVSIVEKMKLTAGHRNLQFKVEGQNDLFVFMDPLILREVAEGLIKNAIENTPDGGTIEVSVEQQGTGILLNIADRGVGITEENQGSLLDGLFHTKETELYTTKKPFEFGAGGKGLDLLRIKYYGQRYGFGIFLKSTRCVYIPTDRDICPGNIAQCDHCKTVEDCEKSGGTTFTVTFPVGKNTGTINEKK